MRLADRERWGITTMNVRAYWAVLAIALSACGGGGSKTPDPTCTSFTYSSWAPEVGWKISATETQHRVVASRRYATAGGGR